MGWKMDRFKAAFRSSSNNQRKYAARRDEVQLLMDELHRLLAVFGGFTDSQGHAHPSYDSYFGQIGDIGVEFQGIKDNSERHPARAFSDLGPFKKKVQALVADTTKRVNDIQKMRAGGEGAFEDLEFGGLKVLEKKSASAAALEAQKALDALLAKVEDLPTSLSGSKKRIDKDIERLARQFADVNRHMSVPWDAWQKKHAEAEEAEDGPGKARLIEEANALAETYEARRKESTKAFGKVTRQADKLLRQITTLAENQLETGVTIGDSPVTLDKRSLPGVEDMDEEETRELLAKVGQKIERGKALADQVLDPTVDLEDLPDPGRKEVADILWYLKTLAEQKVGEPYEKGALTIPDPGNRLRKYLDRCGAIYTRGSSHMTELREEDETGGKEPRGMDFYEGNTSDHIDELLPFGMNTALMQSFEMGGEDKLYLKMETEGSRTPPVQATIGMAVGGLLALGPALVGGLIGGIGGAIAPGSTFQQGAAKGAELAAKPFMHVGNTVMQGLMEFPLWNPGGHAWDAIKTSGKEDMVSSRTSTPKDWYHTAEHGLNLLRSLAGAHNDGLGAFREKLKKQKTLLGEKISHPAVTAYKAIIAATGDGPNLSTLKDALEDGPWQKNVGQMITNLGGLVTAIDRLAQANDRAWDEDGAALLEDADLEAIPKVLKAMQDFEAVVRFEFDVEDLSSTEAITRVGGEVVLSTVDLGMGVTSQYSEEADAHLRQAREVREHLGGRSQLAQQQNGRISRITSVLKTLIAGVDQEDEEDLPELVTRGEGLLDQAREQLDHIKLLRQQIDSDVLVRAGLSPYPDVDVLSDPAKFKRDLAAIVNTSREFIDQIRTLERIAGSAVVDVASLEWELRAAAADRMRGEDHDLFSPQDVVNELETQQEEMEEIVAPLEEVVRGLTEDGREIRLALNLLGSGLEVGDERFLSAVAKLKKRNDERLRQLLSWSSEIASHLRRGDTVPRSASRNPGVTSAVDRYQKKAREIDAVINDNVRILMQLDGEVTEVLV